MVDVWSMQKVTKPQREKDSSVEVDFCSNSWRLVLHNRPAYLECGERRQKLLALADVKDAFYVSLEKVDGWFGTES